jgi:hypothetical protein
VSPVVLLGRARAPEVGPAAIVVRAARREDAIGPRGAEAVVTVAVADPELARDILREVHAALVAAVPARDGDPPVVRLRTRKRLAALRERAALEGAIALIRVTGTNARILADLVAGAREAGAAGVQLVWDGEDPSRDVAEAHVFRVLEESRATPRGMPVVVAEAGVLAEALSILVRRGGYDAASGRR